MSEFNYNHPPITEAVIGINFTDSIIDNNDLQSFSNKFKKYYPNEQVVSNLDVALDTRGSEKTATANVNLIQHQGYRRSSPDMTELLVLWNSSFSVSELAPYKGWDNFISRFMRDWKIWKRVHGSKAISRLGVRFINRIDFPIDKSIDVFQYEDFLNIFPHIPRNWNGLDQYAMQITRRLPEIDCTLLLNTGIVPSPLLDHLSFVIDIDISKAKDIPKRDEDFFALLANIRTCKNQIFEDCINDQTRSLFK